MSASKKPAHFTVAVDHDPAKAPCLCLEFGGGWTRATVRTGAGAATNAEYWPNLEANLAHLAAQMTMAKLEPAPIDGHADAGVLDLLVKYKIVRGAGAYTSAGADAPNRLDFDDTKDEQPTLLQWLALERTKIQSAKLENAKTAKHQHAESDNEVQRVTAVVKAYMQKFGATPSLTDASVVGISKVNNYIKSAANCPRATDDFLARVRALL